jgi:hypothetical protein
MKTRVFALVASLAVAIGFSASARARERDQQRSTSASAPVLQWYDITNSTINAAGYSDLGHQPDRPRQYARLDQLGAGHPGGR